jgi:hypothetical protein
VITFTFIRAADGTPMVKKITNTFTSSYPMVKVLNSHTATIKDEATWPEQLTTILEKEAAAGSALMKGGFDRPLKEESRAGRSDRIAGTRLLALDIDGLGLPGWTEQRDFTKEELEQAADAVLMTMPPFLREASYVVNASASLGTKPGINLHIFLLLDDEIDPKTLKTFLTALNFHTPTVRYQTKLTASGLVLSYPIDRSLADNSRIIYIGTPIFTAIHNPVLERFVYQERDNSLVETSEIIKYLKKINTRDMIDNRIAEAREAEGLSVKVAYTTRMNDGNNHRQSVITNPDKTTLHFVSEHEKHVRFNLGSGDSAAYWVHKSDPCLVHNFKSEPPFLFEQADPEGYKGMLDRYNVTPKEESVHMAIVDIGENKLKLINVNINDMRLVQQPNELSMLNLSHVMQSYGQEMPDPIPACEIIFAPQDPRGVDLDKQFINGYTTPPMLQKEMGIDDIYKEIPYELSSKVLPTLCPAIHKILYSITGCSIEDYHHFVNWLAFIVQEKTKQVQLGSSTGPKAPGKAFSITTY